MSSSFKKVLQISLFALFFISIIIYAFFKSKDMLFGVNIKNVQIAKRGENENIVEISGNAKKAVKLFLNNREIYIDQENNFREVIALLPSYNIINIKAIDKFNNIDEKSYQLIVNK